jgi:PmbA protein
LTSAEKFDLEPLEAASRAVKMALRQGASEAEAYILRARSYSVAVLANKLRDLQSGQDAGIGIRVAIGKRVGFAYATGLTEKSISAAVEAAVKQARVSPEDPHWPGMAHPSSSYPSPAQTYSSDLDSIEPRRLVEEAKSMIDAISHIEGAILSRGAVSTATVERAVANSNGVELHEVGTHAAVVASVVIKRGGTTTPAIFEFSSDRIRIPSAEDAARRASDKALLCTKRYDIERAGRYTVVLAPGPFSELLSATVLYSLRGDTVVRGRSYFRDKVGETMLSEKLTIVDDALMPGGDRTGKFDGEGVAVGTKKLIERGRVLGFVFDTYWGSRAGKHSTGNAQRGSYSDPVLPGYTNVVVEPGGTRLEEMLDEKMVVVLYRVQGVHTSNPDTGEYSVLANPAIVYSHGEPKGWARGIVVSGNFYLELEKSVIELSRETEKPHPGFIAPWIKLAEVTVAPRG